MNIIEQLNRFVPSNMQEREDKIEIIRHLKTSSNIYSRENKTAHMTASAWVVNKERDKVLMIHHNLYNSWSWLGGHADGDKDLLAVAIKEIKEESGLQQVKILSEDIFSLETLTVDGHERRGTYVPSHLHFNITYLLEADENERLIIQPDENSDVAWFTLHDAVAASTEPWFQKHIYSKLNDKLKNFKR